MSKNNKKLKVAQIPIFIVASIGIVIGPIATFTLLVASDGTGLDYAYICLFIGLTIVSILLLKMLRTNIRETLASWIDSFFKYF